MTLGPPRAGSLRAWVVAARVPTLTAAFVPVVVGTAAAARAGALRPLDAAGALIVALAIQIGTNLSNDVMDFVRGADTAARRGPVRVTQSGLLTPAQVAAGAACCFGSAGLAGLGFVLQYGWPVLIAGVLSIASGIAYTGGPWPLGYHGLGDLFVFVFFGLVAVTGTAYVQLGHLSATAVAASVPVGLLATAILVINNLRDLDSDREAGKRTLAVRLGPLGTRWLYTACLAGATLAPAPMRALGLVGGRFWLPWLAAPLGASLVRSIWRDRSAPAVARELRRTSILHLAYGMLLALSLV